MADDITDTEGLRLIAWSLEGGNVQMAEECRRAADEIERLRAELDSEGNEANLLMLEIERLRVAGDALEVALSNQPYTGILVQDVLAALAAWQEARRG